MRRGIPAPGILSPTVKDDSLLDFVLDQLAPLGGVASRRMFGGHGLYLDGEFFGMVFSGRAWFRTDAASRPRYREMGAVPVPFGDDPESTSYWSVPEDVLEDGRTLCAWAREAAATPRPAEQRKAARAGRRKRGEGPPSADAIRGSGPVLTGTHARRAGSRSARPSPGEKGGPTIDSRVTGGLPSKGAARTAQSGSGQRGQ